MRASHCPLCSLVIAVLVDNFQMALLKGLEKVKLEVPHTWGKDRRGGRTTLQGGNPGRTEAFFPASCPGP